MRVLIFRHVMFEGAGYLENILVSRRLAFDYSDLYSPEAVLPSLESYDALVVMGGPMSANDDLPYLRQEIECTRRAVLLGMPVLGICLGAQLLARALGAEVRKNHAKEIGWFEVQFTPAAEEDPLFGGLATETVFHWHGETFDLPSGAELLASSELCRNQAFRGGEGVYGLQFHLEVTPEMIADWATQDANCGDVRELTSPTDPYYNTEYIQKLTDRVFGAWCDIVRSRRINPEHSRA